MTPEQRDHVLKLWEDVGPKAARRAAVRYGYNPDRIKRIAKYRKIKCKKKPPRVPANDHRWQWAIERGAVVA